MPDNNQPKPSRLTLLIIVLAILFLILLFRPAAEPGSHAPGVLPTGTMLYLEVRDFADLRNTLPELPLWKGKAEGLQAATSILNSIQGEFAAFLGNAPELDVGHLLLDIKAAAVAVLPVREGESACVVVLDIDDPEALIRRLRTDLELNLKLQPAGEGEEHDPIYQADLPRTGGKLWVAAVDEMVVLSTVKSPVRWAFKVLRGEYESLTKNPAFKAAGSKILQHSAAWVFADCAALSQKSKNWNRELGLPENSASLGLSLATPTGVKLPVSPVRIFIESKEDGEVKAAGDGKTYPELLKLVPGGVVYAGGFSLASAENIQPLQSLLWSSFTARLKIAEARNAFLDKAVVFGFQKDGHWVRGLACQQSKTVGAMRAVLDQAAGEGVTAKHLKIGEVQCLYYLQPARSGRGSQGGEKQEIAVAMLEDGVIMAQSLGDLESSLAELAKGNLLEEQAFSLQAKINAFDWERDTAFFYNSPAILAPVLGLFSTGLSEEDWEGLLRNDVFSAGALRSEAGRTELRGTFPLYPGSGFSIMGWSWWQVILAIILAPLVLVLAIAVLFILLITILAGYYYLHAWATGSVYAKTVPEPATISPAMRAAAGAPAEGEGGEEIKTGEESASTDKPERE
ncbi:MAG: hypothetical protein JXA52_08390 [Planctomycetes bacterium]|nr:hypothetical protein [Planctomycetota bacterium]